VKEGKREENCRKVRKLGWREKNDFVIGPAKEKEIEK